MCEPIGLSASVSAHGLPNSCNATAGGTASWRRDRTGGTDSRRPPSQQPGVGPPHEAETPTHLPSRRPCGRAQTAVGCRQKPLAQPFRGSQDGTRQGECDRTLRAVTPTAWPALYLPLPSLATTAISIAWRQGSLPHPAQPLRRSGLSTRPQALTPAANLVEHTNNPDGKRIGTSVTDLLPQRRAGS
jgi:hypothetical protein